MKRVPDGQAPCQLSNGISYITPTLMRYGKVLNTHANGAANMPPQAARVSVPLATNIAIPGTELSD